MAYNTWGGYPRADTATPSQIYCPPSARARTRQATMRGETRRRTAVFFSVLFTHIYFPTGFRRVPATVTRERAHANTD